ncbi:MAG: DUF4416 family protein [Syntrophobacterales bacterium]
MSTPAVPQAVKPVASLILARADLTGPVLRRLVASPAHLADWKVFTNSLEKRFTLGGHRLINLDPGYVGRERLVLATGKNYVHRLYLSQGIYGDLTLLAGRRGFQALSWSYPDYAEGPLPEYLTLVRQKYLWQLQQLANQ